KPDSTAPSGEPPAVAGIETQCNGERHTCHQLRWDVVEASEPRTPVHRVAQIIHVEPKEVPPGKVLAIVKQFTETERYSPRILKSSPTRGGGQTIGLVILNHQHLVYAT